MKPWLFRISLSHLSQYPGRTLLGIMGIALGTAVYLEHLPGRRQRGQELSGRGHGGGRQGPVAGPEPRGAPG